MTFLSLRAQDATGYRFEGRGLWRYLLEEGLHELSTQRVPVLRGDGRRFLQRLLQEARGRDRARRALLRVRPRLLQPGQPLAGPLRTRALRLRPGLGRLDALAEGGHELLDGGRAGGG